jgi:heterotetrameric sarcosine oxidase delta subunit
MLQLCCPWCGVRDETEFRYRGDATIVRPPADAPVEEFAAYVYRRVNPHGWHREWWLHTGGCRMLFQIERHTLTHEIRNVMSPETTTAAADTAAN